MPYLTAWQGGPRALELSRLSHTEKVERALISLAKILMRPACEVMYQFDSCEYHDWNLDPLAYGVYSYVGVGGQTVVGELSKPIQKTLIFAGEATQTDSSRGTVHGAIRSGARAAKQALEMLHS